MKTINTVNLIHFLAGDAISLSQFLASFLSSLDASESIRNSLVFILF